MSAPKLATAAGVNQSTVYRIENGQILGTGKTLRAIAQVLGVPMEALFSDNGGDA